MPLEARDILAGPIVRKVQPDLVSVWIAMRKPASVRLQVFRGLGSRSDLTEVPAFSSGGHRRAEACPRARRSQRLSHGHGIASNEPWFVQMIEPNLAGASAIAEHWYELLTSQAPARAPIRAS
jgi:hypothetical protein